MSLIYILAFYAQFVCLHNNNFNIAKVYQSSFNMNNESGGLSKTVKLEDISGLDDLNIPVDLNSNQYSKFK